MSEERHPVQRLIDAARHANVGGWHASLGDAVEAAAAWLKEQRSIAREALGAARKPFSDRAGTHAFVSGAAGIAYRNAMTEAVAEIDRQIKKLAPEREKTKGES